MEEEERIIVQSVRDNISFLFLFAKMDKSINNDYNGIKVRNIISWLLDSEE